MICVFVLGKLHNQCTTEYGAYRKIGGVDILGDEIVAMNY